MDNQLSRGLGEPSPATLSTTDRIHATLVQQLYSLGTTGFSAAFLGAAILTAALWDILPRLYLTLWLASYVVVALLRRWLVIRYFKVGQGSADQRTWEKRFAIGNCAGGSLWALAAIFLFPEESVPHQYMLALFIAGISAGAAAFYWPSQAACIPTILIELLPISGRFMLKMDETGIVTGSVILFFCFVVVTMARYLNAFGIDSVKLQFEKENLVQSLEKARDGLEARVVERTTELSHVNQALRQEISERVRAEEALSKSEEQYRLVVENVQESIFVAQDGCLKFVNRATGALFEYPDSELLSKPFIEFIHPDDRELVYQNHVNRLKGDPVPERYMFRILHKSGAVRWVEITNVLIQWEGRPAVLVFMTDITQRREAEEAVRKSEERYRTFFDTCRDGVFITTRDGRFIDVNDSGLEMLGYRSEEREELRSRPVASIFLDPGDREAHAALVMKKGFAKDFPVQLLKKNGATVDALITTVARKHPDGTVIGFQGTVRDVTEAKRAEKALRESERKYGAFLNSTTDLAFLKDEAFRYVMVNKANQEFFGKDDTEIIGKTDFELMSPEAAQNCRSSDIEALCSKEMVVAEEVLDGRVFETKKFVVQLENGQVCIGGLIRDVTERKKAQAEIRESERRFRLLLDDVSSVPVQGYDANRKVVFWNSASERLYGYSRQEALGRQLEDLIIPTHMRDEVINAVENWMQKSEKIPAAELGLIHKDGTVVPVYSSHVMLENSSGEKEMYRVDLDLADLKKAEGERAHLTDQLRQAQKMEAIGTLAGGIAHDFNNILQVTLGFSDLLLTEKSPIDPEYEDLQRIHQAALSGAELVRNLMTFSRKIEPKLVPLNLNEHVLKSQKLLGRTISKMFEIRLELAGDLAKVDADPGQIEQIIMNLAVNARDAMGEQGRLTIRSENVTLDHEYCRANADAAPGHYVMLSISDTGSGMAAPTIPHIFEPFYTTKEIGRGTGLGLAMVYGIVKQHGGHIVCSSELGRGTTFKMYFPVTSTIQEPADDEEDGAAAAGTETVLLVDDESSVIELGRRVLTRSGYTVITATNGEEALEIYSRDKEAIDLVVLDLIMPIMSGKDCLKGILDINPHARVLVASGYSPGAAPAECLALGAKGFVRKPFRIAELLRQVRKSVDED